MSKRTDGDIIRQGIEMLTPSIVDAERSRLAALVVHWLIDNNHQELISPLLRLIHNRADQTP